MLTVCNISLNIMRCKTRPTPLTLAFVARHGWGKGERSGGRKKGEVLWKARQHAFFSALKHAINNCLHRMALFFPNCVISNSII